MDKKIWKNGDKSEINEFGEELNIDDLVDNIIPKLKEFGKSSERNTHLMRIKCILMGQMAKFFIGFIPKKTTSFQEISFSPIT